MLARAATRSIPLFVGLTLLTLTPRSARAASPPSTGAQVANPEAGANGNWLGLGTPTGRRGATGAWDSKRNRMLIFGGTDGSVYFHDVWQLTWDPAPKWSAVMVTGPGPEGRERAAM